MIGMKVYVNGTLQGFDLKEVEELLGKLKEVENDIKNGKPVEELDLPIRAGFKLDDLVDTIVDNNWLTGYIVKDDIYDEIDVNLDNIDRILTANVNNYRYLPSDVQDNCDVIWMLSYYIKDGAPIDVDNINVLWNYLRFKKNNRTDRLLNNILLKYFPEMVNCLSESWLEDKKVMDVIVKKYPETKKYL